MRQLSFALLPFFATFLPGLAWPSSATAAGGPSMDAPASLNASSCVRIPTPPGPHSLLRLPDSGRLLIAVHDRRHFERAGDILAYESANGRPASLPRSGEPAGLMLRPGHMALTRQGRLTLLHVINHDDSQPNSGRHSVLVYALEKGQLVFRRQLSDPLLSSPNHIAIAPDGDLYVSNDRRDGASMMELLLRRKQATLVQYREGRGWRLVAEGLDYASGVVARADEVLAVSRFGNALLGWPRLADGSLGSRERILSLPALDGLAPGPEPGSWLTVSHGPLLDLLWHWRDGRHPSPATVFLLQPAIRSFQPLLQDDGRHISAMAGVVVADQSLYVGQYFEPFILRCPLNPGKPGSTRADRQ